MYRRTSENILLDQDEPSAESFSPEAEDEAMEGYGCESDSATRSLAFAEPPVVSTSG